MGTPNQMEISILSHLAYASQLSLGIVFLLSVLPKLRHPLVAVRSVIEYEVLPDNVAYLFGVVLILLEAFLATAFLINLWTDIAVPLATVMLLAFLVAVVINLRRGRKISCGCFGNESEQISLHTLARLLLLLTVILLLAILRNIGVVQPPSLISITVGIPTFIYLMQTTFLALFLILMGTWILNLPELVLVFRHWRRNRPSSSRK